MAGWGENPGMGLGKVKDILEFNVLVNKVQDLIREKIIHVPGNLMSCLKNKKKKYMYLVVNN